MKSLLELEAYLHSLSYLQKQKNARLLLICTEIFENIVRSSQGLGPKIHVRFYLQKHVTVLFAFHSSNFHGFLSKMGKTKPWFDPKFNRYRGMGMNMCEELADNMRYNSHKECNIIRGLIL
ncbi:MAG: hypothetical protein ACLFR1_04280 [Spirochaetia bacterium]